MPRDVVTLCNTIYGWGGSTIRAKGLNVPHLVHKFVKSFVRERRFYNVREIFFRRFYV